MTKKPTLHDSDSAAHFIGLKNPGTLAVWRCTKHYEDELPYYKGLGPKIMYDEADLLAFIESRKKGGR